MPKPPVQTPTFAELFTPKLVTVLREGYGLAQLRRDAVAGLTVAIVALPLSMAIAIASGLPPERGLFTAIVGGFIISMLGGSRFQIGGPAGAFIVLVAMIVERHGYDGLVLATFMAGLMLVAAGYLRLGAYIKFIPYPVTVGFTAGIATIIFASQLKEIFGLDLAKEPAAFVPKLEALWAAGPTLRPAALAIALGGIALIILLRRLKPHWPGFLIVVGLTSLIAWVLNLDIATIGTRFGGVPSSLPAPTLPGFSFEKIGAVFQDAVSIAVLGGIESLLSAVVADGMTGRRHRSNCELVAQGFANMASVIFGGMCATGTIARTATNVRSGAHGPVSGMLHAVYLLVFMLVAAPLMSLVPLAALAAVLAVVSWNMAEKAEFWNLIKASMGDRVVLLATYLLTVFQDLTVGISVGVILGAFLFMHRMARQVEIDVRSSVDDVADDPSSAYNSEFATDESLMVYRINGPFFFGATATAGSILDRIGDHPRSLILDFAGVPFIDSTGANTLEGFVRKLRRSGTTVIFSSVPPVLKRSLSAYGLDESHIRYEPTLDAAVAAVRGPAKT